jgi:hypothetical protein
MVRGQISGEGKLKYKNGDSYIGTFKDGRRDGKGYTAFANGDQHEGGYSNDMANGPGILLKREGSEYKGDWKDGKFDGFGSIKYALGGGYAGAWKAGEFHGKGVLTYAGSGRKLETEFENGRVRGAPAVAAPSDGRYSMSGGDPASGSRLLEREANDFPVPFDKSYAELTPEQQATVKSNYRALEEGDEPPYPIHGLKPIFIWIIKAHAQFAAQGKLRLDVLVGKDGNAVSVKTIDAPGPELVKFVAVVVGKEKYKPAVCHGAPCEMVYRFVMNFEERN